MDRTRVVLAAALVAAPLFVACRERETVRVNANNAHIAPRDSVRPLGPGDIRIASGDSGIELALIGDSLITGFGARTREKVAEATDTASVKGEGFAADIEKMVKKTVASALDHELHFPLSTISDVRYEGGLLQFYGANGKPMHLFERSGKNGVSQETVFRSEDAQAFIAAFKAKKARAPTH